LENSCSYRKQLAHFLAARALFGPGDQASHAPSLPKETNQAAWSIGKIIQLLGPLERDEDPKYKLEFDVAELFVRRGIIKMDSLEKELSSVNASPDCINFIRHLLTLDHKKRPTAEEALHHPWLQDLREEET
jgi:serine/threonine protein kinase